LKPVLTVVRIVSYDTNLGSSTMSTRPVQTYSSLQDAFEFFNRLLFGGSLPYVLITVQRHKGACGYFSGDRFGKLDRLEDVVDEIAMNPSYFACRDMQDNLSTLVHEMVHVWQHHHGRRPRRGYHDKQWAAKMKEVGLVPSNTGQPGGKETGQRMSHYIKPGGPFERTCRHYLEQAQPLLYQDLAGDGPGKAKKNSSKTRFTCPQCGLNAWAKPRARLVCGDCLQVMEAYILEDDLDGATVGEPGQGVAV
jgi:hypothetical protein